MSSPSDDLTIDAIESGPTRGDAPVKLERGQTLGRYLILDEIGSGGMGKVYAAYDPDLDRKLAIKLLHIAAREDSSSTGTSRLQREAQAMAKLSHPNVVAVHDVGTHCGRVFVAMEYIDGGTLETFADEGPHPWREVLSRFLAAGRGLAAAHELSLIHRDFKPANVLLGREGRVCVADFGLARRAGESDPHASDARALMLDDQAQPENVLAQTLAASRDMVFEADSSGTKTDSLSLRLTRTGAFVGTPAYMAPEQYLGEELDARSDQFSFCVALWEGLYGQRPFTGDSPAAIAFAMHQGQLREPPDDGPKVPTWIRRILERGLAPHANERWPDMPTLLAALSHDPAIGRRRIFAGLAIVTALVLALVLPPLLAEPEPEPEPEPPLLCQGSEEAFERSWGPHQQALIHARYAKVEAPWAQEHEQHLDELLATWTRGWVEAWSAACSATRIRGEQSEEILDQRMLCLARRRARFETFVQELPAASDDELQGATAAVDDIGDVDDCSDLETLHTRVPPPADPKRRAEYEALFTEFDVVLGMHVLGHYKEALPHLEPAYKAALASGHPNLIAEAHRVRGNHLYLLSENETAAVEFQTAYERGLATGQFGLAQRAAQRMFAVLSKQDKRRDEAEGWLRVAESLAEYLDNDSMRVLLLDNRGRMWRDRGDLDRALPYYQAALDMATELYGPDARRTADALFNISTVLFRHGDIREAREGASRAQAIWADELGPNDARALAALNARGVFAWKAGSRKEASALFEELIERRSQVFGPDHIKVAAAEFNYGSMLGDHRDPRGLPMLERSAARYVAKYGAQSIETAQCQANLAIFLARLEPERIDEALTLIEGARALMQLHRKDTQVDTLTAYAIHTEIIRRRGALDEALALSIQLETLLERAGLTQGSLVVDACVERGQILLMKDRHEAALEVLEHCDLVAAKDLESSSPRKSAERDIMLAEVLRALGREDEAGHAAERARTQWAEISEPVPSDEVLARLEAWSDTPAEASDVRKP